MIYLGSLITPDRDDNSTNIATTESVMGNRAVAVEIINYTSTGQPVNRLKVVLKKVGGLTDSANATTDVRVGDVLEYHPDDEPIMWSAVITSVIDGNNVQIPTDGLTAYGYTTYGFTGNNVGLQGKITAVK